MQKKQIYVLCTALNYTYNRHYSRELLLGHHSFFFWTTPLNAPQYWHLHVDVRRKVVNPVLSIKVHDRPPWRNEFDRANRLHGSWSERNVPAKKSSKIAKTLTICCKSKIFIRRITRFRRLFVSHHHQTKAQVLDQRIQTVVFIIQKFADPPITQKSGGKKIRITFRFE